MVYFLSSSNDNFNFLHLIPVVIETVAEELTGLHVQWAGRTGVIALIGEGTVVLHVAVVSRRLYNTNTDSVNTRLCAVVHFSDSDSLL